MEELSKSIVAENDLLNILDPDPNHVEPIKPPRMVTVTLPAEDMRKICIILACSQDDGEDAKITRKVANNTTVEDLKRYHRKFFFADMGW